MSNQIASERKTVILSFTAPIEFGPYLHRVAKRHGINQSQFICRLVEAYFEKKKFSGLKALLP